MEKDDSKELKNLIVKLDKKFDGLDKRFDGVDKKFGSLDKKFSDETRRLGVIIESVDHKVGLLAEQQVGFANQLHNIQEVQEAHTEMIGKLAINLEIVKEDIEFIKGDLKKKVDIDEFMALERRVALLERKI